MHLTHGYVEKVLISGSKVGVHLTHGCDIYMGGYGKFALQLRAQRTFGFCFGQQRKVAVELICETCTHEDGNLDCSTIV